jgi:uncharacterized protein
LSYTVPSIWLLLNDRTRQRSQLLGVAERLIWPVQVKEIRYNRLAALPNPLLGSRLWHVTSHTRVGLCAPWPDMVIAAGRRAAPVMLAIKKKSPATQLVQLLWPQTSPEEFDLIVLPHHGAVGREESNTLLTLGFPHSITPAKMVAEARQWHPQVARLPRPHIALFVGGDARGAEYMEADFRALGAYAAAEAERLGGSLLVASGPRTGEKGEDLVKFPLTVPHLFCRWSAGKEPPVAAFLGLADAIIATGDSVSMCSQACATGKPIYVFVPPHSAVGKKNFCDTLFTQGHAKPHTYPIRFDWQPAPFPDAAGTVARRVQMLLAT